MFDCSDSRHFLSKAPVYGISAEAAATHLQDLSISPPLVPRRPPTTSRLEKLREIGADAPFGVIVSQFGENDVDQVYCNEEASRLLGYSPEEIARGVADPTDSFWMRVWQVEDYQRLFSQSFGAMLQQQSGTRTRGWFNHSSGTPAGAFLCAVRKPLCACRFWMWSPPLAHSSHPRALSVALAVAGRLQV